MTTPKPLLEAIESLSFRTEDGHARIVQIGERVRADDPAAAGPRRIYFTAADGSTAEKQADLDRLAASQKALREAAAARAARDDALVISRGERPDEAPRPRGWWQ